jgi:IPT/TIG domain/Glucose / Sorbosone dehydrogenase
MDTLLYRWSDYFARLTNLLLFTALVDPSGLTGLEFGDNGEIYIQCASNTNGGVPGRLTGKQIQKDNYYSSATVVASLADPLFNGAITYTAADDGVPNGGYGIDIFAAGTRNPFGICLHSNGNIYASDNGPNFSYGDMMTGCGVGESKPDVTEGDKINLLVKGGYYGQPNRIRALTKNDPRQCVWRSQYEPSGGGYTAPILKTQSSTDGLIEFNGDHFDKQLRGNLIAAKYQGSLYRIILTPDGKGVIPQSDPVIQLTPDVDALDVTQAPDGTLISTSLERNALYFHKPIEQPTTNLKVNSVFPGRGSQVGGNTLQIFGVNFYNPTTVVVGGRTCTVTLVTSTKLECTMPGGSGTVDIVVSGGNGLPYTFARGYRYITGLPL